MKEFDENRKIKCEDIEKLLIKQEIENLSREERNLIQQHVQTCINCQDYQTQLASIENSMEINQSSLLQPDPAIRQKLINRFEVLKAKKHRFINIIWQSLLSMLEYRIPVYQGLIGVASFILIFVVIHSSSFSFRHQADRLNYTPMMADTTFSEINVIKNLQIIEHQKIGKNVNEDSLLTRFIVSSM